MQHHHCIPCSFLVWYLLPTQAFSVTPAKLKPWTTVIKVCYRVSNLPFPPRRSCFSNYNPEILNSCRFRSLSAVTITSFGLKALQHFHPRFRLSLILPAHLHVSALRAVNSTVFKMAEKKPFERLPKTVKPSHYELFLHPDLKTLTFDGKETVKIEVSDFTNLIIVQ